MNLIGGCIGGSIGALVGAIIWAMVSYFSNYEVGYIAWAVGGLAGGGVALGSRSQAGTTGGAIAVVLALLGIAAGKWGSIEMSFRSYFDPDQMAIAAIADDVEADRTEAGIRTLAPSKKSVDSLKDEYAPEIWSEATSRWNQLSPSEQDEARKFPPCVHKDFMVTHIADDLIEERERKGEKFTWPLGFDAESAWRKSHYPPAIWQDAEKRWTAMSPTDQTDYRNKVVASGAARQSQAMSAFHSQASSQGFIASIGLFDVLWVVLAVGTAYRLGSATIIRRTSATDRFAAPM